MHCESGRPGLPGDSLQVCNFFEWAWETKGLLFFFFKARECHAHPVATRYCSSNRSSNVLCAWQDRDNQWINKKLFRVYLKISSLCFLLYTTNKFQPKRAKLKSLVQRWALTTSTRVQPRLRWFAWTQQRQSWTVSWQRLSIHALNIRKWRHSKFRSIT